VSLGRRWEKSTVATVQVVAGRQARLETPSPARLTPRARCPGARRARGGWSVTRPPEHRGCGDERRPAHPLKPGVQSVPVKADHPGQTLDARLEISASGIPTLLIARPEARPWQRCRGSRGGCCARRSARPRRHPARGSGTAGRRATPTDTAHGSYPSRPAHRAPLAPAGQTGSTWSTGTTACGYQATRSSPSSISAPPASDARGGEQAAEVLGARATDTQVRRHPGVVGLGGRGLELAVHVGSQQPERPATAHIGCVGMQETPAVTPSRSSPDHAPVSMYPLATSRARSLRRASNSDLYTALRLTRAPARARPSGTPCSTIATKILRWCDVTILVDRAAQQHEQLRPIPRPPRARSRSGQAEDPSPPRLG